MCGATGANIYEVGTRLEMPATVGCCCSHMGQVNRQELKTKWRSLITWDILVPFKDNGFLFGVRLVPVKHCEQKRDMVQLTCSRASLVAEGEKLG